MLTMNNLEMKLRKQFPTKKNSIYNSIQKNKTGLNYTTEAQDLHTEKSQNIAERNYGKFK